MNSLLNLHCGPCALEELIKGTEPPTGAPEPQDGDVQAARAEGRRAEAEGAAHTEPGRRGGSRGRWCWRPAPTLLCGWGQGDSVPLWWGRQKGPCWQIRSTSKLPRPALGLPGKMDFQA